MQAPPPSRVDFKSFLASLSNDDLQDVLNEALGIARSRGLLRVTRPGSVGLHDAVPSNEPLTIQPLRAQWQPPCIPDFVETVWLRRPPFNQPMLCICCTNAEKSAPPFQTAKSCQRDFWSGKGFDQLRRDGVMTDIPECGSPTQPDGWDLHRFPARQGYCLNVHGQRVCLATFGQDKQSFERASCLIVAAVGIALLQREADIRIYDQSGRLTDLVRCVGQILRCPPVFSIDAEIARQCQGRVAVERVATGPQAQRSPANAKPEVHIESLPPVEPMWDFKELWVDAGRARWVPSFDELQSHIAIFNSLADGEDPADEKDPKSGGKFMTAHAAKEFFDRSKLPGEVLSRMWTLTMTKKVRLRLAEFVSLMALIVRLRRRIPEPGQLPQELIQAAEAAAALELKNAATASDVQDDDVAEEEDDDEDDDDDSESAFSAADEPGALPMRMPEFHWLKEAEDWLQWKGWIHQHMNAGPVWIPVLCLRWTHSGIKSNLHFRDGREVFFSLVLPMWRRNQTWNADFPPMDVEVDRTGDLWCLSNRRLAGFRMLQALSAETVWVQCWLKPAGSAKFHRAKTTQCAGLGIQPNRPISSSISFQVMQRYGPDGDE